MTLLEWSYCAEGKFKSKRIHVVPRQMLCIWSALFMLEREVAVDEGAGLTTLGDFLEAVY